MKRLAVPAVVLLIAIAFWRPATSQDNYEERIASLETRVAALEGEAPAATPRSVDLATVTVVAETYTLTGTVELAGDEDNLEVDSDIVDMECYGLRGYDDLAPGAPITVSDSDGRVIGTGEVTRSETISSGRDFRRCALHWTVEDLPRSDFYAVELTHRGELTYSFEELEEMDWHVESSVGP